MRCGSFGLTGLGLARAAGVMLALAAGGCMTRSGDTTGSITAAPQISQQQWRERLDGLAKNYEANPTDRNAVFNYTTALRALGQLPQATAILQAAVLKHPNDLPLLGLYGRILADGGELRQAQDVLQRSHVPEKPDWRILSVQGTVSDQLGEHDNARQYYEAALKIMPGEPSILSNYGLSLALSRKLPEAERVLKQAAAHPRADARVRQNLVLALGLQGKFAEAEQVARQDQSPGEAATTVADLKRMVGQPNSWEMLKGKPGAGRGSLQGRAAPQRAPQTPPGENEPG
jgi:Flp pilus assembly protein TadD